MKGAVFCNQVFAGVLERNTNGSFHFTYDASYLNDQHQPSISISLPKSKIHFESSTLFPFFAGLVTEGINKEIQCSLLKIDENDDFNLLLHTASHDTIGAITVKAI